MLKRFKKLECNPAITHVEYNQKLEVDIEGEYVVSTLYKQLVGSLTYLCNNKPTISFIVDVVRRFMKCHTILLLLAKILRCIKGNLKYELLFPAKLDANIGELKGYSDSDWCGENVDRMITTRCIFLFHGSSIS